MKKLFVYMIVVLFSILYCQAQDKTKIDSLKRELAKLPPEGRAFKSDTMRVKVLCEMGKLSQNPKIYFEKAIDIALKRKSIALTAHAYLLFGKASSSNQNYYKVGEILFKALLFAEQTKNPTLLAETHTEIGKNFYNLYDYPRARKHFDIAIPLYESAKNYSGMLNGLKLVGNTFIEEKQNKKAIAYYNRCLSLLNKYQQYSLRPNLLGNIAIAFEQEGLLDSAMYYNQLAINEININYPSNLTTKVSCLIEISYIYFLRRNYPQTIKVAQNAIGICDKKNKQLVAFAYRMLYRGYAGNHQYKEGFEYLKNYYELRDSLDGTQREQQLSALRNDYENEINKSKVELLNNDLATKSLQLATKILQRNVFGSLGVFFLIVAVGFWLAKRKISQQKQEITEVKQVLEEFNSSLEEKVQLRTEELTQANIELQLKNEEISRALVEGQTIERKRVATELHDNLGSMLSGVKYQFQVLDKEKLTSKEQKIYEGILRMMNQAYEEVRLISHNILPSELERNGLEGALKCLTSDITQGARLTLHLAYSVTKPLDKKIALELYSVCLELINNILKHSKATQAKILITEVSDEIILEIIDNGIGINHHSTEGMGINNIKNRMESIGGVASFKETIIGTHFWSKVPFKKNIV